MAGQMFNITVDLNALASIKQDVTPDFGMLQQAVIDATRFVRDTWISAVTGTKLPGMIRSVNDDVYAKSLQTGEAMSFPAPLYGIVMSTNDEIVKRIEDGYGAFDMKHAPNGGGLLNGPKTKYDKKGNPYNTIPFRHYTPKSNSPISIGMKMPTDVYAQAKKLTKTTQNADGSINWGQSLDWDKEQRTSWTGYQHVNDINHNMYRVGYQNHTQYVTFRRVSEKSDPKSWWHPGLSGNPVIQSVYDFCMPQVEEMLNKVAEKAFGL
jgi:hypothetical protein